MVVTSLLESPLDHWQYGARAGLAAVLVGIFLWIALHEHFFEWFKRGKRAAGESVPTTPITTPVEAAPVPASGPIAAEVDAVLDTLLAGTISRDEAKARILEITQTHASALS